MPSPADRVRLLDGLVAAIRLSHEPMLLTDPHGDDNPILVPNEAFERLTLYPQRDVVGRNCRFLQGAQTDRRAVASIRECVRRALPCVQYLVNYRRDGTAFSNLLFISPITDHAGQLLFFLGNQREVSETELDELSRFPLGAARVPAGQESELRLLLLDTAFEISNAARAETAPARARAIEAALESARQIGALSVRLYPGAGVRGGE